MTGGVLQFRTLDPAAVEFLLCDADGNLFGSEEPAFEASTAVTNRALADLGIDLSFTPDELRRAAMGRNFRSIVQDLAADAGKTIEPDILEAWVQDERNAVIEHLASVLEPDPAVSKPLTRLARSYELAVVSSSAHPRLAACFTAAGLDGFFPPSVRFSAEDSLPVPTSKPDPAIYRFAGAALGVAEGAALAVEDAEAGVRSAVAAGFPAVGNLQFVAPDEREERIIALRRAGAALVVESWSALADWLGASDELLTSLKVEA